MKLILVFMTIAYSLVAQYESNQWLFNASSVDSCDQFSVIGEECGASVLDFTFLPPKGYRNEKITLDMSEANASICDSMGQLLYYSNGMSIHGQDHQPVINGDTINYISGWNTFVWENENDEPRPSGIRYIQSVGFIPMPAHEDTILAIYQNYTRTGTTGYFDLQYGKLYRNNTGQLEIKDKDTSLNDKINDPGNVHACRHANGRDWWMLQFSRDTVYTYLIDPAGIHLDHLQFLPFELRSGNGSSKFNHQGNMFALFHRYEFQLPDGMDLMIASFDRCSGDLSNHILKKTSSINNAVDNGLEFSPNGRFLYLTKPQFVYQIDLDLLPFINLEEVAFFPEELCELDMFFLNAFGQLQMGADNKIYIGRISQCFDMHVINHPNLKGADCLVERNVIKLPTYTEGTIPNFNTYRLGPLDGSSCDTLSLDNNPVCRFWYEQDSIDFLTAQFWDVSYFRPEEWVWDFGDGTSSTEKHPLHTYTEKGIYEVCLTVSNENSSSTSCQSINIGMVSSVEQTYSYDISVFPNPTADYVRMTFHDYLPQQATVIFYDMSGRQLLQLGLKGGANMLDISELSEGLHLYNIVDQGVVIGTGQVVKI